jgi:2-isopropylmalate synthase
MTPESVGVSEHQIVLTSRSGRHALKSRLEELGYMVTEEELEHTYASFCELADKKKEVFDEDLHALMGDERGHAGETYHLTYVHAVTGNKTIPTATVIVEKEGETVKEAACGDGPVDACYKAIDRAIGVSPKLKDYSLKAVTSGKEALGEVSVLLEDGERTFFGRGASTDIIEASAKAYLRAVNRLIAAGADE